MHELTLTQKLLHTALRCVDGRRIVSVNLLIGPYSEDREETIRFFWRDLAKGTAGEGARLYFRHLQTDAKCLACGGTFYIETEGSICMYCQSGSLKLSSCDEVNIQCVLTE